LKTRSVGAHSICARGGLSYRKRARADMESAPTFFVAGGVPSQRRCPAWSCLPLLKARSVGAHSICARGGLSCRKRARADMESAPTFFVAGGGPSQRRCPAWSCLPLLKAKSVGAHSICARGGLPCRKRARADMESAPTFFVAGGGPPQKAVLRVEFSPFVENEIRRGAFYMRPRKFALPQAGTGGYGIRPYIFCGGRSPLAEAVPRVELSLFVESEIRRGAFYMRPRRFILPQAGTGGYGIRPYIFCGGRSPLAEAVPRVELSPFVESEIRRGAFYMRPRRFILPQAGTGGYGIRPYVFL